MGSLEKESLGVRASEQKKQEKKDKKKKREKERSKRSKRRRDSDSSDEDVSLDESSPKRGKPPSSPLSSASSSPTPKLSPSHKASSCPPPPHLGDRTCGRPTQPKARSQHVTDSPRVKNPSNSSPHSSSSRSPLYYPEVKAPTGVKSLASPLSPLSPGGDVKQEVEAKNGNRVGRMEQGSSQKEEKKKAADQAGLEHSEKKRSERETEKRLKEDDQMLLDSLEKESLGVKASEQKKNRERKTRG